MCEKTLDLGNDYRINVILDEYAEKPDFGSGAPVISIDYGRGYYGNRANAVGNKAEDYVNYIDDFVDKYGNDWDLLERALKIVYGITNLYQFDTRDAVYFVFDPDKTCGTYAKHIRANIVNGTAKEYEAWVNGECYGITVEKAVTGYKRYDNGKVENFTEWEEIESVWGFYGDWILDDKNLEETARDFAPIPD